MQRLQKTIRTEVEINGIGLHTGLNCHLKFKPLDCNSGIVFKRIDLKNAPEILVDIDNILDTKRGTSIIQNNCSVYTVEHLLAAIMGLQIDNILIEISNKELPILDGSSIPFVNILNSAGIFEQELYCKEIVINDSIKCLNSENNSEIYVIPSEEFKITYVIEYDHESIGKQEVELHDLKKEFVKEFAPARTFCLLSEVKSMRNGGLIKGASIKNSLVFLDNCDNSNQLFELKNLFKIKTELFRGNNGILNGIKLRYFNEPVRHKVLDLLGDLALLGAPIKGHIFAKRSGHKTNIELVKKIRSCYNRN